jgi:hypothetical protein
LFPNKTDCLSWYISDASFVIATYLSKLDIEGRDRGKHAIYLEMIQTWVTYEVVKVLYIYGLNPERSEQLETVAPHIETYIKYVIDTESNFASHADAKEIHEVLLNKTQHAGTFAKCNFSGMADIKWKEEVKFMIPLLVLTWLRQLQQFFKRKQNKLRSWSSLGSYAPHLKLQHGEKSDPLAIVYMQKPGSIEQVKVQQFTDIKPDESYIKETSKRVVFPSLEEWAMLILKPPHETRLEQAKNANEETKDRWNRCKIKIQDGYQFQMTQTDFTKEKEDRTDEQTQKPTLNYSNQSKEFLHAAIIDGLICGQLNMKKLEKKTKPTKDEATLITSMKNMVSAYIALASNTYNETFHSLDEIRKYVVKKEKKNNDK